MWHRQDMYAQAAVIWRLNWLACKHDVWNAYFNLKQKIHHFHLHTHGKQDWATQYDIKNTT